MLDNAAFVPALSKKSLWSIWWSVVWCVRAFVGVGVVGVWCVLQYSFYVRGDDNNEESALLVVVRYRP